MPHAINHDKYSATRTDAPLYHCHKYAPTHEVLYERSELTSQRESAWSGSEQGVDEKENMNPNGHPRDSIFFDYSDDREESKHHDYPLWDTRVNKKFKAKKRKANLEMNKNWNGPYDENFFTEFEGLLDDVIAEVLAKNLLKHKQEEDHYGQAASKGTAGTASSTCSSYNCLLQRAQLLHKDKETPCPCAQAPCSSCNKRYKQALAPKRRKKANRKRKGRVVRRRLRIRI